MLVRKMMRQKRTRFRSNYKAPTGVTMKNGLFQAKNVKLFETAINNFVLRIEIPKLDKRKNGIRTVTPVKRPRGRPPLKKRYLQIVEKPDPAFIKNFSDNIKKNFVDIRANGNFLKVSPKPEEDKHYHLVFQPYKRNVNGKLNYDLKQLLSQVRLVKLPSDGWKVRAIFQLQHVLSIQFSNKKELERCVIFNNDMDYFYVTIDNRRAILLGSPSTVDCMKDVEVLLNIVHNIESDNPMVFYT